MTTLTRRFQKEMHLLYNLQVNNSGFQLNVIDYTREYVVVYMTLVDKIILELVFEIPKSFPFQNPNLKINNYNYIDYLHIDPKYFDKFEVSMCLCCSSLLCRNNWHCSNKLVDIVNEVFKNFTLKLRAMQLRYCKKIVGKYFGFYLPICEFI